MEQYEEHEECLWTSEDDDRCLDYINWTKFPDEISIKQIRKSLRKRRVPIFLEMQGDHGRIGWYSVSDDEDPTCSWLVIGGSEKSFKMSEICNNSELERDRWEFGMLNAAFCHNFGSVIRRTYGDSTEVINYGVRCLQRAEDFKHWAKVSAGHMLFPKNKNGS